MENIHAFCELFYGSHYLPISYYRDGIWQASFSSLPSCHEISKAAVSAMLEGKRNPAVYFLPTVGMYGIVEEKHTGHHIVVGPVVSGEITSHMVSGFLVQNVIPRGLYREVESFLHGLPKYTFNQFINLLSFLHYTLNGEHLNTMEHFRVWNFDRAKELASTYTLQSALAKEEEYTHGTYQFEQLMLSYIRQGSRKQLNDLLQAASAMENLREGTLAQSPLRQEKNLFIGLATMVGKVGAIEGGMDIEEAYRLIDLYIQECEKEQSIENILTLEHHMLLDFAERVAKRKLPSGVSKEVNDCIQYIRNHTNAPIELDAVARRIQKSRAYITRRFKQETGKTIRDFWMEAKIEDARDLLLHSDMSIPAISEYLRFSTQSYFQNIFKQYYGVTPSVYRRTDRDKTIL